MVIIPAPIDFQGQWLTTNIVTVTRSILCEFLFGTGLAYCNNQNAWTLATCLILIDIWQCNNKF